jgi:hypothetical protein
MTLRMKPGPDRSELAELVKRKQAEFDALPPEQQQEIRRAQRRSWVLGETMLANPDMTRERAEELVDQCLREAGYI